MLKIQIQFHLSVFGYLILWRRRQWHPTQVLFLAWKIPWTEELGRLLAVHGVARSWTWLSGFTFTSHFHALEKAMATHSSVLAWRIPGTGESGGLPSMGSHRVEHNWSDLAAAAHQNCTEPLPLKEFSSPIHVTFLCTCQHRVLQWSVFWSASSSKEVMDSGYLLFFPNTVSRP